MGRSSLLVRYQSSVTTALTSGLADMTSTSCLLAETAEPGSNNGGTSLKITFAPILSIVREGLVDQRTGRRVAQKADEDDAVGFVVDRLFEISRQLVGRPPREYFTVGPRSSSA
jgi:hypothetical protein